MRFSMRDICAFFDAFILSVNVQVRLSRLSMCACAFGRSLCMCVVVVGPCACACFSSVDVSETIACDEVCVEVKRMRMSCFLLPFMRVAGCHSCVLPVAIHACVCAKLRCRHVFSCVVCCSFALLLYLAQCLVRCVGVFSLRCMRAFCMCSVAWHGSFLLRCMRVFVCVACMCAVARHACFL